MNWRGAIRRTPWWTWLFWAGCIVVGGYIGLHLPH